MITSQLRNILKWELINISEKQDQYTKDTHQVSKEANPNFSSQNGYINKILTFRTFTAISNWVRLHMKHYILVKDLNI